MIPVTMLNIVQALGLPGAILVIWWYDQRRMNGLRKMLSDYHEVAKNLHEVIIQNTKVLTNVQNSTSEVQLGYSRISRDLRKIITNNTRAMTEVSKLAADVKDITVTNAQSLNRIEQRVAKRK